MQLTTLFQRRSLRFLAIVLGVVVFVSLFFQEQIQRVYAQLADRAPLHFSVYGIRPEQRLAVEIRDPSSAGGAYSAITNKTILTAIVTGFSGNSQEFLYTWGVKKRDRDGNVQPLHPADLADANVFNQKIQTFAAIGENCKPPRCLPLKSETYGDLILVSEQEVDLQQLTKQVQQSNGFIGLGAVPVWRESTTKGKYILQYFDRLKKDASGNYTISAYDQWAKDNGLAAGSQQADADKDGFVPKFGGQEALYSIANDPGRSDVDYWAERRVKWAASMCGSIQEKSLTYSKDSSGNCTAPASTDVKLPQGRFYCYGDPQLSSQALLTAPVNGVQWFKDPARIDGVKLEGFASLFDPSTPVGQSFWCSKTANGSTRSFPFVTCGASSEFAKYWEDSWKQYRDGDSLKSDRDVRRAMQACLQAAVGEYDQNSNQIDHTNCFVYDKAHEEDVQTGCFHAFPGVRDGSSLVPPNASGSFTNKQEFIYGTDPNNADSDGDGVVDAGDIMGYRQTQITVPIAQLKQLASASSTLDQTLRTNTSQVSPDDGSTFEFSVDVEGQANIAQRMPDPSTTDTAVATSRIYHVSSTKTQNLDLRSQIQVTPDVGPTFPNTHQDVTFKIGLSFGSSGVTSPGDFYFKWYRIVNGERSANVEREGSGADGFDELILKNQETGELEYAVDVYLRDPDTGELYYIKTVTKKAIVNPGMEIVTDSKTSCYKKGSTAKLTAKTQRRNGDLFFSWFVDGKEYDASTTGLSFDAENPSLGGSGSPTDDVLLDSQVLNLPITKDAPDEYTIQIAYTNSIATAISPNPGVASKKIYVCDPQQGTVVNIDNPSTQFNYRAGLKIGNTAKALAQPGVTAQLSAKLDPLLAEVSNLTYKWTVQQNNKEVSGVSGSTQQKISFPLTGTAGADVYDVLVEVTDPANASTKVVASLNIALVSDASTVQQEPTIPDRPTNINQLIQNLANFRSLTLSRAIETLFRLGLILAGITALAFVALGGNLYLVGSASGNTTAITEGRDRIVSALLGLALAFASWIILNTINPDLLSLRNLNLGTASTTTQTTPIPPAQPSQTQGTKPAGTECTASTDCAGNLVCAPIVVGQAKQTCTKGCTKDADCGAGQTCVTLGSASKTYTGYCSTTPAASASVAPSP